MHRRGLITGAVAFLCAPAIVRIASLMPISVQPRYLAPGVDDLARALYYQSSDEDLSNSCRCIRCGGDQYTGCVKEMHGHFIAHIREAVQQSYPRAALLHA